MAYDYGTIVTVTTSGGQSVDFLSVAGFIPSTVRLVMSSTSDACYHNFGATASTSAGYQMVASEAVTITRTEHDTKSRPAMQTLAFVCGSTQTASVRVYAQAF